MMYHLSTKIFLCVVVTLLSGWVGYRAFRSEQSGPGRSWVLLSGVFGVTFLLRVLYAVNMERNVDTSLWMTGALAVEHFPEKIWTLLNYSDSRPFTVLPLVVFNALGFKVDYFFAECLGLMLTLGSLAFMHETFRGSIRLSARESVLLVTAACLFWGTASLIDYTAYNSEMVSVFCLSAAIWGYYKCLRTAAATPGMVAVTGLLVGCLPYIKLQNVPMGLVVAAFLGVELLRKKQLGNVLVLTVSGLVPTLLIYGYFAWRGAGDVFLMDYFWQYFYYSYTNDFSSLPPSERFTLSRIYHFVYRGTLQSLVYLVGLTGAIGAAGGYFYHYRHRLPPDWMREVLFGMALLMTSLYAVLQAGNFFLHYLLLYLFALHASTGLFLSLLPQQARRIVLSVVLLMAWLQGGVNLLFRRALPANYADNATLHRLVKGIEQLSKPGEPLFVWGYNTQLHVYSKRPPSYSRILSEWLYHPRPSLHQYRLHQFYKQMEELKPRVIVDVQSPRLSLNGDEAHRLKNFPDISRYVFKHYEYVGDVEGAQFYRRKDAPRPSAESRRVGWEESGIASAKKSTSVLIQPGYLSRTGVDGSDGESVSVRNH